LLALFGEFFLGHLNAVGAEERWFAACPARAESFIGVPRIVDGDTLELGQVTIRLHGIDAPEVAQPGGRDAVAALAALVDGKQTVCTGTKRDDYNRLIATCNAGAGDVSAMLIQEGRAWAYIKYPRQALMSAKGSAAFVASARLWMPGGEHPTGTRVP